MKTEIYKHIEVLVNRYPVLNSVKDEIVEAYFLLVESYKNEGKLLIAGNGGSAADAEHIVGELMKGFKLPRKLNENFTDKLISENEELGTVLADTLRNGAASGHYYENYVVMELVKNYAYAKSKVNITYFRDSNAKEIDVFLDENNVIHPLEIKKSASPDRREVKKYSVIDKASLNRGNGGIICMCEEPIPIDKDNCFIPSNLI